MNDVGFASVCAAELVGDTSALLFSDMIVDDAGNTAAYTTPLNLPRLEVPSMVAAVGFP